MPETGKNSSGILEIELPISLRDLVVFDKKGPMWNYFIGAPVFAGTKYSNDFDTTSLAMVVPEDIPVEEKNMAMEAIPANLNPDGLPYVSHHIGPPRLFTTMEVRRLS